MIKNYDNFYYKIKHSVFVLYEMHYLNSQIKLCEATSVISDTFFFQPNLISIVKVVILIFYLFRMRNPVF